MIKSLVINQYRKFKQVTLNFGSGLNALSGTNGTCKTSLLHMISNSFQAVTTKCPWMRDPKCLAIINAINKETNPKSLFRYLREKGKAGIIIQKGER